MYEYDDGEEGGRSTGRMIATIVGVVALALVGWFVVKPRLGGGDDAGGSAIPADASTTTAASDDSIAAGPGDATSTTVEAETGPTVKTEKPASDGPTTTAGSTTTAPPTTAPPTTAAPTTAAPYETLPTGEPLPAVVVFSESSITLTGVVPDEAAKQRLQDLAIGSAKPGQAATVTNNLTINPAVPRTAGVRVVELTSTRFPPGSAEVLPPHALELDRAVGIMKALPNISVLVIGHADQRGDDLQNYALSEDRALAVKNYMISQGIAFDRVQSRAVGEADLLTLDDDAAALALNRRTEFVFVGLLV